jgi:hypothetical protein
MVGLASAGGVVFTRMVPKACVIFITSRPNALVLAQKRHGLDYADLNGKMLKSSASNTTPEQRLMSETTKCIVRCCELRKRRVGQGPLFPDPQRIRVKLDN